MKTKVLGEEPYGDLICSHVKKEFPHVVKFTECELVENLSNLIIGSKEVRYGCLPTPEHLVVIRAAVKEAIINNKPIPVLVPWGSIKADFSATLDIAELSALQRLIQLYDAVKEHYEPALEIVVRVEDTSGYTLFTLEGNMAAINNNIDSYSKDMKTLVTILAGSRNIRVQLESEMVYANQFEEVFYKKVNLMEEYLFESWSAIQFYSEQAAKLPSYAELRDSGWRGIISYEQRNHYIEAYKRIYPNWEMSTYIKRLALYFTGAWVRHILEMTGKQSYWNKFIQLAFIPPIKGLPEGYNFNYVYYRTLPLSEARTHISPWRAKGYLKMNGNSVQHKLVSFNDEIVKELIPVQVEISDEENKLSVVINANYYLES